MLPKRAVALEGEKFLVIFHIENRFCGIDNPPCHGDADLNRVSETVVDFLTAVVQRHDFK